MSEPMVSIVMSCYNSESTMDKSIGSICNQSFSDFEFIIIDDGSTDRTLEKLSNWSSKDDRIIVIKNEQNIGLAASLNKGIEKAKAPYIARMDADDEALPKRLELQKDYLLNHPHIDLLGTAIIRRNKRHEIIGKTILPGKHDDIIKRIFRKTLVFHPTIMAKKSLFEIHGMYDPKLKWAEDADLWYRIYDKIQFANLKEPLLIYTVKDRLTLLQARMNLTVKISNLKRRKMLVSFLPVIAFDILLLSKKVAGI